MPKWFCNSFGFVLWLNLPVYSNFFKVKKEYRVRDSREGCLFFTCFLTIAAPSND